MVAGGPDLSRLASSRKYKHRHIMQFLQSKTLTSLILLTFVMNRTISKAEENETTSTSTVLVTKRIRFYGDKEFVNYPYVVAIGKLWEEHSLKKNESGDDFDQQFWKTPAPPPRNENFTILCTGSLINPRWVLTIARCAHPHRYRIRAYDLVKDPFNKQDYNLITSILIHPNYTAHKNIDTYFNPHLAPPFFDISLLRVDQTIVKFYPVLSRGDYTLMVGRWTRYVSLSSPPSFMRNVTKRLRQFVRVPLVGQASIKRCPPIRGKPDESICALQGTYSGLRRIPDDLGGPLMFRGFLVGLLTKAAKTKRQMKYTPVAAFMYWIEDAIRGFEITEIRWTTPKLFHFGTTTELTTKRTKTTTTPDENDTTTAAH